jgi:tetratricopeptide (TPR) repeat protein
MLKTPFCSICIFLLTILSASRLYASDYFSNALRIFSEGRFFEASIEFERAIYYENDSNRIAQCKYYKSLCYKGLGEYDRALGELKSINIYRVPDSLSFMVLYEQALCSYLDNDVNQALRDIDEIRIKFKDTLIYTDILPLNILCMNTLRNWSNAITLWNKYIENSRLQDSLKSIFKNEIIRLYNIENIPRFYSPGKAGNLSRFIPGSGQMYCGSIPEGALNFLINVTLLGYSAWEIYFKYYFTGNFIGLGLFNKFYLGGIHRAYNLAMEKNAEGIKRFNVENSSLMIRIISTKYLKE